MNEYKQSNTLEDTWIRASIISHQKSEKTNNLDFSNFATKVKKVKLKFNKVLSDTEICWCRDVHDHTFAKIAIININVLLPVLLSQMIWIL